MPVVACLAIDLLSPPPMARVPGWDRPLTPSVRSVPVLASKPWVRGLGPLQMTVQTQGWRFPLPADLPPTQSKAPAKITAEKAGSDDASPGEEPEALEPEILGPLGKTTKIGRAHV